MALEIKNLLAVLDVNSKINSIQDVKSILKDISHYSSALLNAEGSSILLVDSNTGNLTFEVAFGENADALLDMVIPKGKGIVGFVAENKVHVIVNDTQNDDRFYKNVDEVTNLQTKNLLAVPLIHKDMVIGVIEVINKMNGNFTEDDVTLISHFAQQAAIALANALLYKDINDKASELEILYQISNLTNITYDKKELFGKIVELLSKTFRSERVSIMFINEKTGKLYIESAIGIPFELMEEIANEINSSRISSRVLNLGKVLYSNDMEKMGLGRNKKLRYRKNAFISVPIKVKNIPVGVINISEPEEDFNYTTELIKTLQTIANQVGHTYEGMMNYNEKIEHEKIKKEVDIMRTLQNALLLSDFREYKNISVYAKMKPAEIVGGDFYDIYNLSPSKIGFVIGDVSGKGLPASLFMAVSRSVIKAYAFQTKEPSKLLQYANKILVDDSRVGMFVTVFYGIFDTEMGVLEYSNAGHNLQFLYRPDTDEFISLSTKGIPLGIGALESYENHSIQLESGDIVFAFTDGVLEANNQKGEEFGLTNIKKIVREYSATNATTFVNSMIREVDNWSEGTAQWDDITVIGFKIP